MRKKLALILISTGLIFAGWNGFSWVNESSSGKEAIGKNDIVKADKTTKLEEEKSVVEQYKIEEVPSEKNGDFLEKEVLIHSNQTKREERIEKPKSRNYEEYDRGANIGWLLIPAIDMKYPLYWGTDDETLTQGVGYHVGEFTTPPDRLGHTVLSGHRDTVFRELGELKEGAKMYVQFEGVQYEYEIKKTWITNAEDRTVIVNKEEPTLTLTTCYPFRFIGAAPDRYIIEAPLISKTDI
ncbi:class D sortase [Planococcus shenhongbingii]|uniref:class D sortase n=1 Tax=Planococcus shenhongbingii TaxID=3058398 RepID=UPI002636B114|nr:class D sortase [Planococcus sp. N016]WKA56936.1 class D sortase [Planococcus sp. N016]